MTYNIYINPSKYRVISQWLKHSTALPTVENFTKNDISLSEPRRFQRMVCVTINEDEFTRLYDFLYEEQEKIPEMIDRDLIIGEYLKRTGMEPKMSYHPITQEVESEVYLISLIIEEYYNVNQK